MLFYIFEVCTMYTQISFNMFIKTFQNAFIDVMVIISS